MNYFQGIEDMTKLQEERILLLREKPDEISEINSEFMKKKDAMLGSVKEPDGQAKHKFRRIEYTIENKPDNDAYVKISGSSIHVSTPVSPIFNAELLGGAVMLPKVTTPATMAIFLPPVAPVPVYYFT